MIVSCPRVRALASRSRPAWFLLLFAPVSAEYLIGYDDTIGNPAALIFGLVIFAPLYGAPAVLIRELTRRTGRGWPTMLLLGLAFGLVQAGLIDQSLFNPHYRDISYWGNLRNPTLIHGAGTSLAMLASFVGEHVVSSICAPIALAESMVPRRSMHPWLRPSGLVIMAVLWTAGAGYVLSDTLHNESFRPSAGQLTVTVLIVLALIAVAFTRPRRPPVQATGPVPAPVLVLVLSTLCLGVRPLLDSLCDRTATAGGWAPTLAGLAILLSFGLLLRRWSSRTGWTGRHVLAVAAGALLSVTAVAFTVEPVGHVGPGAKHAANSALFVLVLVLLRAALVRQRVRRRRSKCALPGTDAEIAG
jgi:hypothetical protein